MAQPPVSSESQEQRVTEFVSVLPVAPGRGRQDHRRPRRDRHPGPDRHLRGRPRAPGRRAGSRQDAADQDARREPRAVVLAHPVHAGPDAGRHHRHQHHRGGRAAGGSTSSSSAGPIFAHILLADEVNRATPKTQSALLEGMQEGAVTVAGSAHPLPAPFFVLATQNPIEMEGTYPLPEAQLDRFLFKLRVRYPALEELTEIIDRTTHVRAVERAARADRAAGALDARAGARDPDRRPRARPRLVHRARHPSPVGAGAGVGAPLHPLRGEPARGAGAGAGGEGPRARPTAGST